MQGDAGGSLDALRYAPPRAELCCDLGAWFMQQQSCRTTIFWYNSKLACALPEYVYVFIIHGCYDFVPYLQLCVIRSAG